MTKDTYTAVDSTADGASGLLGSLIDRMEDHGYITSSGDITVSERDGAPEATRFEASADVETKSLTRGKHTQAALARITTPTARRG